MKAILHRLLLVSSMMLATAGCLLDCEAAVSPDEEADPRLEGVWQITKKSPKEVRSDRDADDIGVKGYIAAKGSQPFRSEANRASPAAGSHR